MIYIYIDDNDLISFSKDKDKVIDSGFTILDDVYTLDELIKYIMSYYNMSYKNSVKYIKEIDEII